MKLKLKSTKPLAVLNGLKRIYNCTKEQQSEIKEELTFSNPSYQSAIRYARNLNYVRIPPYITYYNRGVDEKGNSYIETPLGYTPNFDCKILDKRALNEVTFPDFVLELRLAQQEAFKSFCESNESDFKGLIVLPTGKGKSILGLKIASHLKQKTLIIVHKDDLVVGWKKDIELCFNNELKSGLIKASSRKVGEQITIATIQTLNKLSDEDFNKLENEFGLVILDEAHHCPASSYDCLMRFNSRYKLGLTATPERTDGTKYILNLHFGGICYKYENTDDEKDILPVEVIRRTITQLVDPVFTFNRRTGYTLSEDKSLWCKKPNKNSGLIQYSSIPYEQRPKVSHQEIEDCVLNQPLVLKAIISDIFEEYKKGSNIVCFFTQKKHIDLFYSFLKEIVPIDKIQCYYGDSKLTSKEAIENAESGKVKITLTTYAKSTEGTNVKSWGVAFLISSLNNGKNVEQAVGRIRRTAPNKPKVSKVYDYDYTNTVILRSHFQTRLARYRKLGFKVANLNSNRIFGGK